MTPDHLESFPTVVRSSAEWGVDLALPFAVVQIWGVPTGRGPEEESRPLAIPLDPDLISEVEQRLTGAPTVALPWDADSDEEPFDLARLGGQAVVVHRPPGLLTLVDDQLTYRIDRTVTALEIEPSPLNGRL